MKSIRFPRENHVFLTKEIQISEGVPQEIGFPLFCNVLMPGGGGGGSRGAGEFGFLDFGVWFS